MITSIELLNYVRHVLARRGIVYVEVGGVVASKTSLQLLVL
jgi:hypothetical protein